MKEPTDQLEGLTDEELSFLEHATWDGVSSEDNMRSALTRLAAERRAHAHTKRSYLDACWTIAQMHAAAVGEVCGPKRGVVEDVADVASELAATKRLLAEAEETISDACSALDVGRSEPFNTKELGNTIRTLIENARDILARRAKEGT